MTISSIVAISNNNAIGVDNDLPWHLPGDLKFFKETTMGKHVLMGRKSFESIGRPLPGRTNIIVTRNRNFYHSGVIVSYSISDGILLAKKAGVDELFILGGSNIYHQTMNLWDKLYITRVNAHIDHATAFFPEIIEDQWNLISEEAYAADKNNKYDYSFCVYHRI